MPNNTQMKNALKLGFVIMVYDFLLETVAFYLDWWYPKGGTQFPPIVIVPLEMVASFLIIGTSFSFLFSIPKVLQESHWEGLKVLRKIFEKPKMDYFFYILLIIINALVGMNGDYSAGTTIWEAGPNWHPIYTFFVWLSGGVLALGIYLKLYRISIKAKLEQV